jgi:hypothetical protein
MDGANRYREENSCGKCPNGNAAIILNKLCHFQFYALKTLSSS